jgi:Protein of unknown function (DUF2628)
MSSEGTPSGGFGRRGAPSPLVPSPSSRSRDRPSGGGAAGTETNLVLAFIGENIDRFKATVEAMAKKSDTLSLPVVSWCWPAFFFNYLWLVYRRMYAAALGAYIILAVLVTACHVIIPIPVQFSVVPLMVLFGLFGKSLYVMLATRRVRSILEEERNATAAVISVRARGGTSWRAVCGALVLSWLAKVLLTLAIVGYGFSHPNAPSIDAVAKKLSTGVR